MATDKNRVTSYVNDYEYARIEALAAKKGVSMSRLLPALVSFYENYKDYPGYDYDFRHRGWIKSSNI